MAMKVPKEFKHRWSALLKQYTRSIQLLKRNRLKFKRLHRNYNKLKYLYARSQKGGADRPELVFAKQADQNYQLILDHHHRIRHIAPELLQAIEMTQDEFCGSIYIDLLFKHYLPLDFSGYEDLRIAAFHFPVMLEHLAEEEEPDVHPFLHLSISGTRAYDRKSQLYLYYLSIRDITAETELDYFQKSDKLVKALSSANVHLQTARKTIEMHKIMLISLVCSIIEEHNKETADHLRKIQTLSSFLTAECKRSGLAKPKNYPLDEYLEDINYTSILHDIGKAAIPRDLIGKGGSLNPVEYELIKKHPQYGANYILKIIDRFKADPAFASYTSFLTIPYQICLYHHERWDGRGYPRGLAGQQIPFPARVIAIVDAYDAMRAQRAYNKIKTHEECIRVLREESGRQFDPQLVQAFLRIEGQCRALDYKTSPTKPGDTL